MILGFSECYCYDVVSITYPGDYFGSLNQYASNAKKGIGIQEYKIAF